VNSPDLQLQKPPTLRDHLQIRRNAVGLALMLAGVLTFIVFHFTKIQGDNGWDLWRELVNFIASRRFLQNTEALLGFSGFITLSIGTLISPFLITLLIHNPWIKWCLAAFAAMAAGIMWYFTAKEAVVFLLMLALTPTFTLAGLLCIRTTSHLPYNS
jgi:hypothetical protein